jgi:hypothetical protein
MSKSIGLSKSTGAVAELAAYLTAVAESANLPDRR